MATVNQVGVGLSGASGSGSFAGTTSATLTTPVIGEGTITFTGVHSFNGTLTGDTAVTFPTSGTLATTTSASGVVNSGLINQLTWYAATGTTVSGLTTANNGILVTSSGGAPSIGNSVGADLIIHGVNVGLGGGSVATNTILGTSALATNTTGAQNVAIGYQALTAMDGNNDNIAIGYQAMLNCDTSVVSSIAIGTNSMSGVNAGADNIAIGKNALSSSIFQASDTIAIGSSAGAAFANGNQGIFIGYQAASLITNATAVTVIGYQAMKSATNVVGGSSVIIGALAMSAATAPGVANVIVGKSAVASASYTGTLNVILGASSGAALTSGSNNLILGYNTANNTVSGSASVTTGSNNTLLGYQAAANNAACAGAIALGADSIARIATGATSSDNGPGISLGSSLFPVGFRGDGTIYSGGTGRGYWRPNLNGTAYLVPCFIDGTLTASASMVTDANGSPILTAAMTDGQIIIGGTGATPVAANLIAGTGITISNAAGSITISSPDSGISWFGISGTTQAAAVNSGYIVQNASATTITLPATAAIGDSVSIRGLGAGGWILTANTGQTVKYITATTSSGGTLTSAEQYDTVDVTCIVANTTWSVNSAATTGLAVA